MAKLRELRALSLGMLLVGCALAGCTQDVHDPHFSTPEPSPVAVSSLAAGCPKVTLGVAELQRQTGERGLAVTITNASQEPCSMQGVPVMSLADGQGALPFLLRSRTSSPYVSHARPVNVPLDRGAKAYVIVAKYRCDAGELRKATRLQITLPGSDSALTMAIPENAGLSTCQGGPQDPGQVLSVSAVSSSYQQAVG